MALTYLESARSAAPSLEEPLSQCIELYRRRLYHQLTDLIEQITSDRVDGMNWLEFAEHFLRDFRQHMNTLRYAQLIVTISGFEPNLTAASAFVQEALTSIEEGKDTPNSPGAKVMLNCQLVYFELLECRNAAADTKHIKQKLIEIGVQIEKSATLTAASVQSLYHRVAAFYYQGEEDYTNFYSHGIRYLSYTETDGMHDLDQWVHDIAIAAIVAPSFYDFGELSLNPSISALGDSWVSQLLNIFIQAVPDEYNRFCQENEAALNGTAAIASRRAVIDEKMRLLSLVKLAFYKPSVERVLSFREIADVTQYPDVETMLMRAMSLKLINGKIDQLDETVSISYVKPRILNMEEIEASVDRIGGWMTKIDDIHNEVAPVISSLAD